MIKIKELSFNEEIFRNIYLRKLLVGEIQGPLTNLPGVDKEWLKYYSEEQIKSNLPEETISDYMEKGNLEYLNNYAIIYFDKKITYREFFQRRDECVASLIKNNIRQGDVVTICMPGTPETLVVFYALNKIGAIAHMVHPLSSENQIKDYVNKVDSKLIITIDA